MCDRMRARANAIVRPSGANTGANPPRVPGTALTRPPGTAVRKICSRPSTFPANARNLPSGDHVGANPNSGSGPLVRSVPPAITRGRPPDWLAVRISRFFAPRSSIWNANRGSSETEAFALLPPPAANARTARARAAARWIRMESGLPRDPGRVSTPACRRSLPFSTGSWLGRSRRRLLRRGRGSPSLATESSRFPNSA